jgi:glycosyltransferase involved in cell wall biosynthesis
VRESSSSEAEISVVMPFRNVAPYIRDQLEALERQTYAGPWELVAVDNASSDASRRIVESFGDRLPLRIVEAPVKPNASYARNVGARAASGTNLIFLDADDAVAPGYLGAMAEAFASHDFVTSRLESNALNPEWVALAHGAPAETDIHAFPGFLPFAGGGIGLSRQVFEAVGGFHEELTPAEDIALSWDVQLAGVPLGFVPDAVLHYRHRGSLRELYRQTRSWGAVLPALYRQYRHAGMARNPARDGLREWLRLPRDLVHARSKADLADLAVRLGYRVGQLEGSIRHRVLYL